MTRLGPPGTAGYSLRLESLLVDQRIFPGSRQGAHCSISPSAHTLSWGPCGLHVESNMKNQLKRRKGASDFFLYIYFLRYQIPRT